MGPRESSLIASAVSSVSGNVSSPMIIASATSSRRRAPVEARPARGVGEDQLPETQPLAADLAGQPFIKGVGLIHRQAVEHFQFEKQIEGQSPSPLGERNDDSVGAISADD